MNGVMNVFFAHIVQNQEVYACILFNNIFEYKVQKQKQDINGNYIAVDIVIDNKQTYVN